MTLYGRRPHSGWELNQCAMLVPLDGENRSSYRAGHPTLLDSRLSLGKMLIYWLLTRSDVRAYERLVMSPISHGRNPSSFIPLTEDAEYVRLNRRRTHIAGVGSNMDEGVRSRIGQKARPCVRLEFWPPKRHMTRGRETSQLSRTLKWHAAVDKRQVCRGKMHRNPRAEVSGGGVGHLPALEPELLPVLGRTSSSGFEQDAGLGNLHRNLCPACQKHPFPPPKDQGPNVAAHLLRARSSQPVPVTRNGPRHGQRSTRTARFSESGDPWPSVERPPIAYPLCNMARVVKDFLSFRRRLVPPITGARPCFHWIGGGKHTALSQTPNMVGWSSKIRVGPFRSEISYTTVLQASVLGSVGPCRVTSHFSPSVAPFLLHNIQ